MDLSNKIAHESTPIADSLPAPDEPALPGMEDTPAAEPAELVPPTAPQRYTSAAELESWFKFHPPTSPMVAQAHELVRELCGDIAAALNDLLPECPEKTIALRSIQRAMWAGNAAIAIHQLAYPDYHTPADNPV